MTLASWYSMPLAPILRAASWAVSTGSSAEMDRDATIARLKAGKAIWRAQGKRTDGRWPYGGHPLVEYAGEREICKRIHAMRAEGKTHYSIAKTLNSEGLRTRYNCEFSVNTIKQILGRRIDVEK